MHVSVSSRQMLSDAADHLRSAIELLDRAEAPGHIAANTDLALNQLVDLLEVSVASSRQAPRATGDEFDTRRPAAASGSS